MNNPMNPVKHKQVNRGIPRGERRNFQWLTVGECGILWLTIIKALVMYAKAMQLFSRAKKQAELLVDVSNIVPLQTTGTKAKGERYLLGFLYWLLLWGGERGPRSGEWWLLWWLVLCVNLTSPWYPHSWSNASPAITVKVFFKWD